MRSLEIETHPVMLGENRQLFGIRTSRRENTSTCGVIILNAGLLHHVGPFQLHVDIANQLSQTGLPVLRIDQSGKGESPKRIGKSRLESIVIDYDESLAELQLLGVSKTILIGLCSGADDAIFIAPKRNSVAGLVLLDGYAYKTAPFFVRHYTRRIFFPAPWFRALKRLIKGLDMKASRESEEVAAINIRDWASDGEMIDYYADSLVRDTKILSIFTSGQNYYNHMGQLASGLPKGSKLENLREVYFDDADHTYTAVYHRNRLLEIIENWVKMHF